jgi:hypothetical protein
MSSVFRQINGLRCLVLQQRSCSHANKRITNNKLKEDLLAKRSVALINKLKGLYCQQIVPLEKYYHFEAFHSPPMGDADFDAKPMILFIGQYSTGKSSMIRYRMDIFRKTYA